MAKKEKSKEEEMVEGPKGKKGGFGDAIKNVKRKAKCKKKGK